MAKIILQTCRRHFYFFQKNVKDGISTPKMKDVVFFQEGSSTKCATSKNFAPANSSNLLLWHPLRCLTDLNCS